MTKKAAVAPEPESGLTNDLVEALQDSRVVEALGKALAPLITLSVEEGLRKQLEGLTNKVRELKAENLRLNQQCETIVKANENLQKIVDDHSRRLDDIEAYSRSDNLIFRGLPESSLAEAASSAPALEDGSAQLRETNKSVETTIITFCSSALGMTVQPQDISIAHRLKAGTKDKYRPIIVRFASRQVRNAIYSTRKLLKDAKDPVYISEHLTKSTSDLFYAARKMLRDKKISGTWTQGGHVFVRFTSDPTERPTLVKCSNDLRLRS